MLCDCLQNHFVRHNTPHPKELKARHPKVFAKTSKDVDGHVIPHNPEKKSEVYYTGHVSNVSRNLVQHLICVIFVNLCYFVRNYIVYRCSEF